MAMDRLFQLMKEKNASDMFFAVNSPVHIKINGNLIPINQQKLERKLFTDPLVVTELLQRYYRDQGYLAAEIDEPRIEYQGTTARIAMAVREGARFSVRRVATSGNKAWGSQALLEQLPVMADEPFLPSAAEQALIPDNIRKARFDMYLVLYDGSAGTHNAPHALTLLESAQNWVQEELNR